MKKISKKLIQAARGDIPCDLLLTNAKVVNVFTGEICETSVAVWDKFIVGFGDYEASDTCDLNGSYISPGFIDGHVHIESSMLTVPQFARAIVPRGTTSIVADPHEIANVMGYDGIRYILETSKHNPLNVFIMLPSCVPATHLETSGAELRAFDLYPYFKEKWVLGLGEMMNFPGVINCDPDVLDKLKISHEKRIDGHAPGLKGKDLYAYVTAGIASDHECTTVEEARDKLRLGMQLMIREGTAARNLSTLLPVVTDGNSSRCSFVTDDRHPCDLVREGHIDYIVRKAIREGLSPVTAIQMATINSARYFMLNELGAIAPGYYADMIVFDSLENIQVRKVYKNGKLVSEDGKTLWEVPEQRRIMLRGSVNIKWLEGREFSIKAESDKMRVINVIEDELVTTCSIENVIKDGEFAVASPADDILKLAVIERHRATGNIGFGFVKGFGLKRGALATTIAHDSHNIIVIGTNDEDMLEAVIHLNKIGGGMVACNDGNVVSALALPVAGLMSDEPLEIVNSQMNDMIVASHSLGCVHKDPFMALSFLALPVIPELKLTDLGLVDVNLFKHVPLFVQEPSGE
jgi:adenine deaminase